MGDLHATPAHRFGVMRPDLIDASNRALDHLETSVLGPGFKENGHDDVAYFFKAPAAFLGAGRRQEAARAWTLLLPYLETGGALSGNPAYSDQYPMYPWYWMARAAQRLSEAEALRRAQRSLASFVHRTLHGATVKAPFTTGGPNTVDLFMTAALGQVQCLSGDDRDLAGAMAAGDLLLRSIAAQPGDGSRFLLRMNDDGTLVDELPAGEPAPFYSVQRSAGGQLFFRRPPNHRPTSRSQSALSSLPSRANARCNNTRVAPSLAPRSSAISACDKPPNRDRVITSRYCSGRRASAASRAASSSRLTSSPLGVWKLSIACSASGTVRRASRTCRSQCFL